MVVSIDIGTSYSSICVKNQEGKAEAVETSTGISIYGSKYSLPSAVFVEEDGKVLVGQAAMNSRKRLPQNFRSEFKRDLGQNIPIVLGRRSFLPEELYTEMFRYMVACVQKGGSGEIEKAYITYPASYGKMKQEKIRKAAKNAGLFHTELIDEPTAAAMCYESKGYWKQGDILLVYDFGGGTFDVSLMRYGNGAYEPLVPAMGIAHCGGIDIDRAIYLDMLSHVDKDIRNQIAANPLNRMRFEGQLAELAVKIKHHLSAAEYAKEAISVGFDIVDYQLERRRLNEMIAPIVISTIDCCKKILESAGVKLRDVSGILMVGGSSRIPFVQEMVRTFAGDVLVHTDVDMDLAVAFGALEKREESKTETADEQYLMGVQFEEKQNYEKAAECYGRAAEKIYANFRRDAKVMDMAKEGIHREIATGIERREAKPKFVNMLGRMTGNAQAEYDSGLSFEAANNFAKAAECYRTAAKQGLAAAQYRLALMYESGQGVAKNDTSAAEFYRAAAKQGHRLAQNNLGVLYGSGRGVRRDDEKSVEWYQKSAGQNLIIAEYNLGVKLYEGQGIAQDYGKAMTCFANAAAQGLAYAKYNLGIGYYEGLGVEQDYAKAAKWFADALAQDYTRAGYPLGVLYEAGYGVEQDYEKAAQCYRRAAERECKGAQYRLGILYHGGMGVGRDYIKAAQWYRKAIENEKNSAMQRFNRMQYAAGEKHENEKDYEKAVACYQAAARQGFVPAKYRLGMIYLSGPDAFLDYGKAVALFGEAAEHGDFGAKYHLALCYCKGQGVERNYEKAAALFGEAAEHGDIDAQYMLGIMCHEGLGVEKNFGKAAQWFLKAANQGLADAWYNLGVLHYEGNGVKQDYAKAAEYFEKAALTGDADASQNLGQMQEAGKGIPQDYGKAAQWYRKAAELGNTNASHNLALLYYEGRGVEQDYAKAAACFAAAAEQGNAAAQYNIGVMEEIGQGIPQDYGEAAQWYGKAAEQGHTAAQRNLAALYAKGQGVAQDFEKAVYWYLKAENPERKIEESRVTQIEKIRLKGYE